LYLLVLKDPAAQELSGQAMHGHGINFHKIIFNSLELENRKNQIQKKLTACFFQFWNLIGSGSRNFKSLFRFALAPERRY